MMRLLLAGLAIALCGLAGSTACAPAPSDGSGIAETAAACQKTGQQCRLGQGGALGVCHKRPNAPGYACTPQH